MTTEQNIKSGKWTAIFSFIIATILMGLFYLTNSFMLAAFSYFIILGAGILINFFCLVALLIRAYQEAAQRLKIAKTIGLMLCNIPVTILYIYFVTVLFSTMRMTFVNETGRPLTEIKIIGCEPKTIDKLDHNESKKIWVGITGDCSMKIEYVIDGEKKSEIIYDYLTNNGGQIATYKIGTEKPLEYAY
jgi:amino acid transporter